MLQVSTTMDHVTLIKGIVMESNRGGVREGAGRKPSNKKTVVIRVPVELIPMIEAAKLKLLQQTPIQQLAKRYGVSEKDILAAKAIADASPEMAERIESGELTIRQATAMLRKKGIING